jgi:hypothetical protein
LFCRLNTTLGTPALSFYLGNAGLLVFTNENGNRAEGRFTSPTEVEATEWGGLRGTIEDDGNTIRWDNGGAWQKGLPPIVREVIDGVTNELGDFGRFRVRLGMQPTANVTVFFDTSKNDRGQDEALLVTSSFQKEFTPENWDQFQDVVVFGQDDNVVDGDVPYRVLGVAASDDPRYDRLHMADANFVNLDDDTADQVGFDGQYRGLYTGSAQGGAISVDGTVAAVIQNGQITVTAPAAGNGTVSPTGQATFVAGGGAGGNTSFTGTFVLGPIPDGISSERSARGTGTWFSDLGGGLIARGTWFANRVVGDGVQI